jgi:hypothetical protein
VESAIKVIAVKRELGQLEVRGRVRMDMEFLQ